jgi:threonine dehydratase
MAGRRKGRGSSEKLAVSAADVKAAMKVLDGKHRRTPIMLSRSLSETTGRSVWLKFENMQRSGSYKFRGAFVKIASLSDKERRKGVVAASTGNNALAVARAATMQGVKAIVVVPDGMALPRAEIATYYGAEVRYAGGSYGEANLAAERLAEDAGMTLIHPYDDPKVIAGQGTIGLELLEEVADVDTVLVPIGGGALVSGIALAMHAKDPRIRIIGVQATRAPPQEMRSPDGSAVNIRRITSIADDITIRMPGRLTMPIIRKHVHQVVTVDEDEIARAFIFLLERHKTAAEGAGAVPTAAILYNKVKDLGDNVVALISAGNMDVNMMSKVILQGLRKAGRYLTVRVQMEDRPGRLYDLLEAIHGVGANILDVRHIRFKPNVPYGTVELILSFETRNEEHSQQLLDLILQAPGTDLVESE